MSKTCKMCIKNTNDFQKLLNFTSPSYSISCYFPKHVTGGYALGAKTCQCKHFGGAKALVSFVNSRLLICWGGQNIMRSTKDYEH